LRKFDPSCERRSPDELTEIPTEEPKVTMGEAMTP
jgi:hypothetical protein